LLLDAAFHSPATMACLSASLRSRVDAPGLHLQSRLKVSLGPPGVKDKSNFQDYKYLVLDGLKYYYSYTS
jgi:hypothetical protein